MPFTKQQPAQRKQKPSFLEQQKTVALPDFEKDINTLIDTFYAEVQSGKPCDLATFKSVWVHLNFSFIHQATPSVLNAVDHLQLLYSSALNRIDTHWHATTLQLTGTPADQGTGEEEAPEPHTDEGQGVWDATLPHTNPNLADDPHATQGRPPPSAVSGGPSASPSRPPRAQPPGQSPARHDAHHHHHHSGGHDQAQAAYLRELDDLFSLLDDVAPLHDGPGDGDQGAFEPGQGPGPGLGEGPEAGPGLGRGPEAGPGAGLAAATVSAAAGLGAEGEQAPGAGLGAGVAAGAGAGQEPEGHPLAPAPEAGVTPLPGAAGQTPMVAAAVTHGALPADMQGQDPGSQAPQGPPALPTPPTPGEQPLLLMPPPPHHAGDEAFALWLEGAAAGEQVPAGAASGDHLGDWAHAQQQPAAPAQAPPPDLPPLAVRVGAIYALYCLYQTQIQTPRCRIYVPLVLLELVTAMVPELLACGAFEAVRMLQVLWQDNAFVVGCTRRPASFAPEPYLGPSGARRTYVANSTLSVSTSLLHDRAARDALYHLRSDLRSLVEYRRLGQAVSKYHAARESIFAGASSAPGASEFAGLAGHGPAPSALPPMLFSEKYADELRHLIEDQAKRVHLSLLPESRPKKMPGKLARGAGGQEAALRSEASRQAARDRRKARRTGVVAEDLPGAVNEQRQARQAEGTAPASDDELQAALQGLSGRTAQVIVRQYERRRQCSQVQDLWLSAYEQLAEQEERQEAQAGRQGGGGRGGGGVPAQERAGGAARAAGEGPQVGSDCGGSEGCNGQGGEAADGMEVDGGEGGPGDGEEGGGLEEDAALAAELDEEFGQAFDDDEGGDPDGEGGQEAGRAAMDVDEPPGPAPASGAPPPAPDAPVHVPVWCRGKVGVATVSGKAVHVRCFCPECCEPTAGGTVSARHPAMESAAFMQHCGLKNSKWRESLAVDEGLLGAVKAHPADNAYLRRLLRGRTPVKRNAKKIGAWLREAHPSSQAAGRAGAGKKRARAAVDGQDGAEPPGVADPAAAPALAPHSPPPPMEISAEYADLLAQLDAASKAVADVQRRLNQ